MYEEEDSILKYLLEMPSDKFRKLLLRYVIEGTHEQQAKMMIEYAKQREDLEGLSVLVEKIITGGFIEINMVSLEDIRNVITEVLRYELNHDKPKDIQGSIVSDASSKLPSVIDSVLKIHGNTAHSTTGKSDLYTVRKSSKAGFGGRRRKDIQGCGPHGPGESDPGDGSKPTGNKSKGK